jgi:dTDP-4-amino-4,6-dideoxygalactose transaminase
MFEGDEVITVSHTFIAPIEEIIHVGARPILVDVKEDALMDVDQIEAAITPRTRAILPVHLSGKVCDMKRIKKIAENHGLFIIEDACQALGASRDGVMAGTFGEAGCFSFISPKLMGGAGDGGGITTNSRTLYERILLLRNHWNITQNALIGLNILQPEEMNWGWNSRLDNIQAAILNVKLKYYPEILARRKEISGMYEEGLKDLPIKLPTHQPDQVAQEYLVQVDDIWGFKKFLAELGIETLVRDTTPNHKLKGLHLDHFELPITERLAKSSLRLPIAPELTNEEVQYVIDMVKEYYGDKNAINR